MEKEQCIYCNSKQTVLSKGRLEVIIEDGELIMIDYAKESDHVLDIEDRIEIEYCPFCGRKI